MSSDIKAMERNVALFSLYKAATSVMPWLPVFFLYFLERVSLGEAVLLGSASYFCVFMLEVPSGYCSDRYGRRPTLIFAALMALIACALFLVANTFVVLVIAQLMLASRIAFQSGSDSALLYDSLRALGRENEYTERETAAQQWSMTALACSCLIGGALGMVDLRLAYFVGFLFAIATLFLSIKFVEPPVENQQVTGFVTQLKETVRYFSHPLLGWILGFFIVGYSLEHIPYEFYQPYLKLLGQSESISWLAESAAPMVSGVVIGISMFGGAVGAAVSQRLMNRVGLRFVLLASIGCQLIIIGGMSLLLHPAVLLLVMFRNFSMSMAHGPMLGAIAPHVSSAQRATFLSALSLCGRASLAFGLMMLSVLVVGTDALNWPALAQVLITSVVVGSVALALLYWWSSRITGQFSTQT